METSWRRTHDRRPSQSRSAIALRSRLATPKKEGRRKFQEVATLFLLQLERPCGRPRVCFPIPNTPSRGADATEHQAALSDLCATLAEMFSPSRVKRDGATVGGCPSGAVSNSAFLNIARHVAPHVHSRPSQQAREAFLSQSPLILRMR